MGLSAWRSWKSHGKNEEFLPACSRKPTFDCTTARTTAKWRAPAERPMYGDRRLSPRPANRCVQLNGCCTLETAGPVVPGLVSATGRSESFASPQNRHSLSHTDPVVGNCTRPRDREPYHYAPIARSNSGFAQALLSLWHDRLLKLQFRTTSDRGCRLCNGAARELTLVFAIPRPVTTLIRDVQPHEFPRVSHRSVNDDRRSDIFTSQTMTSLFWSTRAERLLRVYGAIKIPLFAK